MALKRDLENLESQSFTSPRTNGEDQVLYQIKCLINAILRA
jgi:hypothetical protein